MIKFFLVCTCVVVITMRMMTEMVVGKDIVVVNDPNARRDINGDIMDVHDGNTFYDVNTKLYLYYGASYGMCTEPMGPNGCANTTVGACGFQTNHNVSLFTSTDLLNWTPHPPVFQMAVNLVGILFCPKVIYNTHTNMYVLWYNWIDASKGFAASYYAVSVSPSPYGPFKIVNKDIEMGYGDTGDFSLFADSDGSGYIIYTAHIQGYPITHQMSVERLTSDFLGTMGLSQNSGFFGDSFVEAPAMFKRNNIYYAVFGKCCCYCQAGSPVIAYTSSSPLGPWAATTSLGPNIPAQQTNVLQYNSPSGPAYLWQGDMWQSAPDHIKGRDFTYWGALVFDNNNNIQPLPYLTNFTISVI